MRTRLCGTCTLAAAGESAPTTSEKIHSSDDPYLEGYVDPIEYIHHQTFVTFHEAKTLGCSICSRLWTRLYSDRGFIPPTKEGFNITYYFLAAIEDADIVTWSFVVTGDGEDRNGAGLLIEFDLFRDETRRYDRAEEPAVVNALAMQNHQNILQDIDHEITPTTDSVFTFTLVQYWLSNCQANHPRCQRNTDLHYPLPLRVIDVGMIGESSVRLFVSESSFKYGTYITLSHCWGDSNIMQLTVENEHALKAGFEIRDLPKTFRQAIQFTRALSVKYLWIDSLCILQDSVDDWRHQSALMGDIYKHCFCNIAATSSFNSDGGIFLEREPYLLKPLHLGLKWKSHQDMPAYQGRYHMWDSGLWETCVRQSPLNRRGWVLQERLLAPRIVHFSKYIFWECGSMTACEIMPTGKPVPASERDETFYTGLIHIIEELSLTNDSPIEKVQALIESAHNFWWSLVEKHSTCELTKDTDILVVISGIASIMETALKDQYVAGLWKSTLLEDLLWKATFSSARMPPSQFRAPSWSWASVKGRIDPGPFNSPWGGTYEDPHVYLAEIMNVQIVSTGAERNGQIESGFLSILGLLFKDVHEICTKIGHISNNSCLTGDGHDADYANMLCMPILLIDLGRTNIYGLLIKVAPHGHTGGHFVRTGVFNIDLQGEDQPDIEEVQLKLKEWEKRAIILL
jgi:hypothetical protein